MTTISAKAEDIERAWYVIDASDYTLGRLASRVATVLRGKHKPVFTPHVDCGDFVVVVNASEVQLTGNKLDRKGYFNYSGYPGGLRALGARAVRQDDPERMIVQAVRGMLPKNRLSRQVISKLKVYGGSEHPHAAQNPVPFPAHV